MAAKSVSVRLSGDAESLLRAFAEIAGSADITADEIKAKFAEASIALEAMQRSQKKSSSGFEDMRKKVADFQSPISGLMASAMALGPALIPAAAVGAAGFLALGGAVTAAGAGLGALALVVKPSITAVTNAATAWQHYQTVLKETGAKSTQTKTALQAWQETLIGMSPDQVTATKQLVAFKDSFSKWQQSFDPEIMPIFTTGIDAASKALPILRPLVDSAATAVGLLVNDLDHAVTSGGFKRFVNFLSGQAGGAITSFSNLAKGLGEGLAGMMEKSGPLLSTMERDLSGLGSKLSGLGSSHGFDQFLKLVEKDGPQVGRTLEDVAKAIATLVKNAGPLGGIDLKVIDGVAKMINTLGKDHPGLTQIGVMAAALGGLAMHIAPKLAAGLKAVDGLRLGFLKLTGAELDADAAADANPFGLIALAVAGLALGIYELVKHWHAVWDAIKGAVSDVVKFLKAHWEIITEILLAPIAPVLAVFVRFHKQIIGFFEDLGTEVPKLWHEMTSKVSSAASTVWHDVVGFFTHMYSDIESGVSTAVSKVVQFFEGLPGKVMNAVGNLISDMESFGKKIVDAIVRGIGSMGSAVWNAIKSHIPGGGVIGGALHSIGLAEGGIVTKPTLAMVAEAGYPEAVIPLKGGAGVLGYNSSVQPLPSGLANLGAAGPVGAGAPGSTNIYLTSLTNATPQQIAAEVSWALRQRPAA